jgi:hypothetical protein
MQIIAAQVAYMCTNTTTNLGQAPRMKERNKCVSFILETRLGNQDLAGNLKEK